MGAYLLDLACVIPTIALVEIVVGLLLFGVSGDTTGPAPAILANLLVVVGLTYGCVSATMLGLGRLRGQTVGRRALGLYVVRTDGRP